MIATIKNYFHRPTLEERFPYLSFVVIPSVTRKIGLSTHVLDPLYIYRQIETYFETLDPSCPKYEFLKKRMNLIYSELKDLSKFNLETIGRIAIVQNKVAIFDFYLIYDIHIHDIETIVINLDTAIEKPDYYSYILGTMSLAVSVSGLGLILSIFT
jgi:hypothetical protein